MKKILSIILLLTLFLSIPSFSSFAGYHSDIYKSLYEDQRWRNNMDRLDRNLRDLKNDARNERKEKLELQKFKSEEASKKIESANANINETYAQIIKANPCIKDAIEEINRVVYSADQDDVRKTISKLESERNSLKDYKKSLAANSETTVGQLENVNNRLQAIDYELNILNDHYKKNNEYDKKLSKLKRQKKIAFWAGSIAITIGLILTLFGLNIASSCN